jgi:DNA-binding MarR family transcriptional regulator
MTIVTRSFQQLIGQTEKSLNAILDRLLAGAVSEPEWIALVLLSGSGGPADHDGFAARLAHALKVTDETAAGHVLRLGKKGLVENASEGGGVVRLTDAGQQFVARVQKQVAAITLRLWGDLPGADLDVASRVLSTVLERAETELRTRSSA